MDKDGRTGSHLGKIVFLELDAQFLAIELLRYEGSKVAVGYGFGGPLIPAPITHMLLSRLVASSAPRSFC